jgi:diacylglycerol kinase family enzyme
MKNEELKKHLFVINPVSFRGRADLDAVISGIQGCFTNTAGANDCLIHVSRFQRDAVGAIKEHTGRAENNAPVRVYAVGGDGVLFDCLNGIVDMPGAELATVPYGHSNDFMRAFGENRRDLFRDIAAQMQAPSIPTDIIKCGSNYGLNLCAVGLVSDSVAKASELQKKLKKWPPSVRDSIGVYNTTFYLGAFAAMLNKRNHEQEYEIDIDGESINGKYITIIVANGPCCGGNMTPAGGAVPDDGVFDTLFYKSSGNLRGLAHVRPYAQGHYERYPAVFTLKRGTQITIRSREPLLVNIDGEGFVDTNLTITLIPKAVNIVAPGNLPYMRRKIPHA